MSSYVESVIGSGEQVEYEAKVSVWALLPLALLGVILLPLYGLGMIFWLIAILKYITTELTVTNKKIIAKTGFIKRDAIEMLLSKVESIQVNQSILGRMLNYGSVVVAGSDNPQTPVPGIASPIDFRNKFMEIQERTLNNG